MAPLSQIRTAAWALARRQHWAIASRQLRELGVDGDMTKRLRRSGHLHRVFRGVYAVGRPELTWRGWWMAAVLACGPGAVLSHASAAALWRIRPSGRPIHVSAPGMRRPQGIVTHRRSLAPDEVTHHHGIPVTTVACTLIDIAPELTPSEIEAAMNEADKLGLADAEQVRAALVPMRGRAGVDKLRRTIDRRTFTITDSELERRLLPIARRAGLPVPSTQVHVNGLRVDFYFAEIGVVVETDGLRYHRTAAQQARDRLRDQIHTAAGLVPLRFTHAQVMFEPAHVEEVLAAVARRQASPPAPPARRPAR